MPRRTALLATALLAFSLVACGGEDSSSSSTSASQTQAEGADAEAKSALTGEGQRQRDSTAEPAGEEQSAQQVTTRFYDILAEDEGGVNRTTIDLGSFCSLMSEEAREQTVEYAKRSSSIEHDWDCESAVGLLVLRSKRNGAFEGVQRAEVIAVNAVGDRATASVRFGDGPITSVPLVREGGEWKLAGSVTPSGAAGN